MQFKKHCLYCGKPNNSSNYTCDCKSEEWFDQYRVLEVQSHFSETDKQKIIESFHNYSFLAEKGMLQYASIPYRENLPDNMPKVGGTPLYKLEHLGEKYPFDLYVKNEGANPSGCFKDRETMVCLLHTLQNKLQKAVIFSSGNAAASAALFAQKIKLDLITCVAGDTYPEKIEYIKSHGVDVIVIGDKDTNFESGYRLFSKLNSKKLFVEQGIDNWSVRNPFREIGDKTTAVEIIRQLSEGQDENMVPDYVVVPTANGTSLAGLWKGFKELYNLNLINQLPAMVSVGVSGASPIYEMYQRKQIDRPFRCNLGDISVEDSKFGSIILAEEGYDSMQATRAVLESGGMALELHRDEVRKCLKEFLRKEKLLTMEKGIIPEPASIMSIAAVDKIKEEVHPGKNAKIVSILTGHGLKARARISNLLAGDNEFDQQIKDGMNKRADKMEDGSARNGKVLRIREDYDELIEAFGELNPV